MNKLALVMNILAMLYSTNSITLDIAKNNVDFLTFILIFSWFANLYFAILNIKCILIRRCDNIDF